MSREVAQIVIADKLTALRKISYEELVTRIKHPVSEFTTGPDGVQYQLEMQVFLGFEEGWGYPSHGFCRWRRRKRLPADQWKFHPFCGRLVCRRGSIVHHGEIREYSRPGL